MALTATRSTKGFEWIGNLFPGIVDPCIKEFEMTPSLAVEKGDMLVLTAGKVALAAANATNILGVAAEDKTAHATDVTKIQVAIGAFNVYRCTFADHTDGTADSGTTTTLVDAALTQSTDDDWLGSELYIYEGTNKGCRRIISGFDQAADTLTWIDPMPAAIDDTSKYIILGEGDDAGANAIHVGAIGVNLKDHDTIDANAAIDGTDGSGPLGVVAIHPADLMMDVFIRKPLFAPRY